MKLINKILLIVLFLIGTNNSFAQGIRLEYFGITGISSSYNQPDFYGFGYEQNVGDKISLGLTYRAGYDLGGDGSYESDKYSYNKTLSNSAVDQVSFNLTQTSSWKEYSYSSKYHFSDNSDGSFYISNSISLFNATNTYNITDIYVNNNSTSSYDNLGTGTLYEQKITLIPMSFDLGYRSEFDGWYQDYFIGMSFLPFGSKKDVEPSMLADHGVQTKFSALSFRFGLCFGIAW